MDKIDSSIIDKHSLTFKVTALLLSATLVILLTASSIAYSLIRSAYFQIEDEKASTIILQYKHDLALKLATKEKDSAKIIAQKLLEYDEVLYVEINLFDDPTEHIYSKNSENFFALQQQEHFTKIDTIVNPFDNVELGKVSIVYSNRYFIEHMQDMKKVAIISIMLFLVLIFSLVIYIYKSLRPLRYLAYEMENFDVSMPKHLNIDSSENSEIKQITNASNNLIDKIIEHNSDLKELNSTLAMREVHLKDAQRMANLGSWEYYVNNETFEMSTQMRRILGIKNTQNINSFEGFLKHIHVADVDYFNSVIKAAIEKGSLFKVRHKMLNAKGESIEVLTQGKVRKKAEGTIRITAVSMDVSEQAASQQMIERLAYYDSLTSLPNRALFKDRLHKAILQAERYENRLCVMFLDLDHFKLINDTLGHNVGDELLKSVALRLSSILRAVDTISRVGGDEFIILLPLINKKEDAKEVAQKIVNAMKENWMIHSHQLHITTSVGISLFPDDSSDMETLIAHADTAMYHSKENGRDNYSFFRTDMQQKMASQLGLETDLRKAINTKGELVLYYQPKINLVSNKVMSVEALIRWNHPINGLIYPDAFIPLAESTGIIIDIGEMVIEEAIKQISLWQKSGCEVQNIAVNLSGRQFQSQSLISFISNCIAKYEIDPAHLEFEITESISMANIHESLRIMYALKELGVSVSIDDFGTGYSSLAYLKQFSVDTLKVDKSFVLDMIDDDEDKILVQTIISLAHSLGIKVVAEGVESVEHAEMLREMSCDYAQGFYYAKALSVEDLDEYLDDYNLI